MTDADIYPPLTDIMRDVLMQDDLELSPELSAKDVEGWDSFKMIEIIMAVEAQFGIKVPSQQLDKLENVGDLVKVISERAKVAS
ncbi:acyl carrier protein [Rhizosaccharibacter radicis]|uniref:Acyl carrier protein n=1 Tax=Rhizosaccharibacter radicis TaxID=2782605 RepID=A0ABT1W0Q8_9PROT|nr:acyl carrier protein [Acetobacteraceae bacterium KSS12]